MPVDDPKMCEEILTLKNEVKHLASQVQELNEQVKGLVDAWKQGIGVTKFIKFMCFIVAPAVSALFWLKDHLRY